MEAPPTYLAVYHAVGIYHPPPANNLRVLLSSRSNGTATQKNLPAAKQDLVVFFEPLVKHPVPLHGVEEGLRGGLHLRRSPLLAPIISPDCQLHIKGIFFLRVHLIKFRFLHANRLGTTHTHTLPPSFNPTHLFLHSNKLGDGGGHRLDLGRIYCLAHLVCDRPCRVVAVAAVEAHPGIVPCVSRQGTARP